MKWMCGLMVASAVLFGGCGDPELSAGEATTFIGEDGRERMRVTAITEPGTEVHLDTPYSAGTDERDLVTYTEGVADASGRVTLEVDLPGSASREPADTLRATLRVNTGETSSVRVPVDVPRVPMLVPRTGRPPYNWGVRCNVRPCGFTIATTGEASFGELAPGTTVTIGEVTMTAPDVSFPLRAIEHVDLGSAFGDESPTITLPISFGYPNLPQPIRGELTTTTAELLERALARWREAREPLQLSRPAMNRAILWFGGNGRSTQRKQMELVGTSIPLGSLGMAAQINVRQERKGCGVYRSRSGSSRGMTRTLHHLNVSVWDVRTGRMLHDRRFEARDPGCGSTVGANQASAGGGYVPEGDIRAWLLSLL